MKLFRYPILIALFAGFLIPGLAHSSPVIGKAFSASPVASDGKVYLTAETGERVYLNKLKYSSKTKTRFR